MPQICPYCRGTIEDNEVYACPSCGTPHHADCFQENRGCTVFGCDQAPPDEEKISLSHPALATTYHVTSLGQQIGPYTLDEVRQLVANRQIASTEHAWSQGMPEWVPLSQLLGSMVATAPLPPGAPAKAIFLYIPPGRLIAMSIASFGLYESYWIYRNWRFLKERDGLRMQPFWRGVFGVWNVRSLFKAIKTDPQTNQIVSATFSPSGLATGWIVLVVIGYFLGRAHDAGANFLGILISLPAFCFFLPVQNYINAVNESLPERPAYYGWSAGHIVCLVIGIIEWLIILAGLTQSLNQ